MLAGSTKTFTPDWSLYSENETSEYYASIAYIARARVVETQPRQRTVPARVTTRALQVVEHGPHLFFGHALRHRHGVRVELDDLAVSRRDQRLVEQPVSANDARDYNAHYTFQVLRIGKPPFDVVIGNWRAISHKDLTNSRCLTHLVLEPLRSLVVDYIHEACAPARDDAAILRVGVVVELPPVGGVAIAVREVEQAAVIPPPDHLVGHVVSALPCTCVDSIDGCIW